MNKSVWSLQSWEASLLSVILVPLHGKITYAWKDSCHLNFHWCPVTWDRTSRTGSQGYSGRLQVSGPLSLVWMTSGPFPSAPFFFLFLEERPKAQADMSCIEPLVHGCGWWSPMNLRHVLPFIFNSYFCFLNCGLKVLFIQHSKGVFVFFLALFWVRCLLCLSLDRNVFFFLVTSKVFLFIFGFQ